MQQIDGTNEVFYPPARFVSAMEVQCVMPFSIVDIEVQYTKITWIVSVSNNNRTFSGTKKVFVYDSKCLQCSADGATCSQKVRYIRLPTGPWKHWNVNFCKVKALYVLGNDGRGKGKCGFV